MKLRDVILLVLAEHGGEYVLGSISEAELASKIADAVVCEVFARACERDGDKPLGGFC